MKKEVLQVGEEGGNIRGISREEIKEKMQEEIEPLLKSVRKHGFFSREGDNHLYYEKYVSSAAVRTVVICHGFNEHSEKYKEMIYYFYREYSNVYVLDHQGHGKSYRKVEDHLVTHVENFNDYVEDLRMFMKIMVERESGKLPIILFGHSMGATIGATYLEKYPGDFRRAVFSSPMFEMNMTQTPKWLGRMIVDFKVMTGRKKNKKYLDYDVSYSWFKQSVLATRRLLRPENMARIQVPVIVFEAEKDTIVKTEGHIRFVKGVRNAKLVVVPGGRHELFREKDEILTPYLNKIFEFIG
ncbi:alpha/beta fold hydrolase [Konateibacter massiliensis]|uniref:alpha/beta fold hydrolase n=1 Tax=Konateibacter massiliensis TaxID=2002841 RepID=UPI000C14A866|nr:alpha/beta fold hydrolase [Konateibacter massiliensis]